MRIDADMHFTPAEYHAELVERGLLPFPLPEWSAREALPFMDAQAIDVAVLSLSPPGVAFGDQAPRCCGGLCPPEAGARIAHTSVRFVVAPTSPGASALLPCRYTGGLLPDTYVQTGGPSWPFRCSVARRAATGPARWPMIRSSPS
jgi:hypothetical protein